MKIKQYQSLYSLARRTIITKLLCYVNQNGYDWIYEMADKKRRSYSTEFRENVADIVLASNARPLDLAKALNIVPSTVNNWVAKRRKQLGWSVKENQNQDSDSFDLAPEDDPDEIPSDMDEVSKLRLEIKKLRQERLMVKEAILMLTSAEKR